MMNFSDFFNIDEPQCLFCGSHIDDTDSENTYHLTFTQYNCANLECEEVFVDMYFYGTKTSINLRNASYFAFTLKDLQVYVGLDLDTIQISKYNYLLSPKGKILPYFKLNFSDKEALYKKLTSYLIFS